MITLVIVGFIASSFLNADPLGDHGFKLEATTKFNGHTYASYVSDKRPAWSAVKAFCEEIGGHLLCIESANEQKQIESLLVGRSDRYWIGGYCENGTGEWKWVNGEPLSYRNFAWIREDGDSNFVALAKSRQWITIIERPLFVVKAFVCEWDSEIEPPGQGMIPMKSDTETLPVTPSPNAGIKANLVQVNGLLVMPLGGNKYAA